MPLLDLFWTMLIFFLWFAWIMVVFTVLVDIFRNHQMGGFAKALWVFFVIVLPLLGVLIYLIANGDDMARRGLEEAQRRDQAARAYIQDAAGVSTADELQKLGQLHSDGLLTEAEFASQKARLLA
ncbi:MAG: SHOCT domain-containing protein [Acidimicrobiia bacterium]|nr:SHOCT domain-containing protein [Acidimicrobiia bacterium]MDH5292675.1 SHOCT domain-containing protein [Acidimicrobiia bacterium]